MSISKWKLTRFIMAGAIVVVAVVVLLMGSSRPAVASGVQRAQAAVLILPHTPHGSASLTWNAQTQDLTVTIMVVGLAPNSTHPAHIHAGDCSVNGPILIPLNNVVTAASGAATSTTVVHNVQGGIPNSGWYINVHNGPTLGDADQAEPITCGNVPAPVMHNGQQSSKVMLGQAIISPNQHSTAAAVLFIHDGSLTVLIAAKDLDPGSMHAEHIHLGSCESQVPGNVLFPLTPLVADQNGHAVSRTVIPNVSSIPRSGWYINIHRTTDLSTQTGFDPIMCGNVIPF